MTRPLQGRDRWFESARTHAILRGTDVTSESHVPARSKPAKRAQRPSGVSTSRNGSNPPGPTQFSRRSVESREDALAYVRSAEEVRGHLRSSVVLAEARSRNAGLHAGHGAGYPLTLLPPAAARRPLVPSLAPPFETLFDAVGVRRRAGRLSSDWESTRLKIELSPVQIGEAAFSCDRREQWKCSRADSNPEVAAASQPGLGDVDAGLAHAPRTIGGAPGT